jgi:hypothetical protein
MNKNSQQRNVRQKSLKKKTPSRNPSNRLRERTTFSDGVEAQQNQLVRVPRDSFIMPDRLYTKLVFSGSGVLTIPALSFTVAARYRPSSAFDVDPLLGGTIMPGFTELTAIYGAYRVTSSRITVEFVNESTTASCTACVLPLNADPGASPSSATVQSWPGNPYSKYKILPLAGGPSLDLTNEMSTEKIFGSKMVYFDDSFTAAVTTNPVNNWFWAIGLSTNPAAVANINVSNLLKIEIGLEFFDRKALTT